MTQQEAGELRLNRCARVSLMTVGLIMLAVLLACTASCDQKHKVTKGQLSQEQLVKLFDRFGTAVGEERLILGERWVPMGPAGIPRGMPEDAAKAFRALAERLLENGSKLELERHRVLLTHYLKSEYAYQQWMAALLLLKNDDPTGLQALWRMVLDENLSMERRLICHGVLAACVLGVPPQSPLYRDRLRQARSEDLVRLLQNKETSPILLKHLLTPIIRGALYEMSDSLTDAIIEYGLSEHADPEVQARIPRFVEVLEWDKVKRLAGLVDSKHRAVRKAVVLMLVRFGKADDGLMSDAWRKNEGEFRLALLETIARSTGVANSIHVGKGVTAIGFGKRAMAKRWSLLIELLPSLSFKRDSMANLEVTQVLVGIVVEIASEQSPEEALSGIKLVAQQWQRFRKSVVQPRSWEQWRDHNYARILSDDTAVPTEFEDRLDEWVQYSDLYYYEKAFGTVTNYFENPELSRNPSPITLLRLTSAHARWHWNEGKLIPSAKSE